MGNLQGKTKNKGISRKEASGRKIDSANRFLDPELVIGTWKVKKSE